MLQWGPSAAGGDDSWAIACWYYDGYSGKHLFHTPLTSVYPGDKLNVCINLKAQSGQLYSFECWFMQAQVNTLKIISVPQFTSALTGAHRPALSSTLTIRLSNRLRLPRLRSWCGDKKRRSTGAPASCPPWTVDIRWWSVTRLPGGRWIPATSAPPNFQAYPRQTIQTGSAPALASFNGKMYSAFQSNDSSHSLCISSTVDERVWPAPVRLPNINIGSAPSLAVFNGRLYCAFPGERRLPLRSTSRRPRME